MDADLNLNNDDYKIRLPSPEEYINLKNISRLLGLNRIWRNVSMHLSSVNRVTSVSFGHVSRSVNNNMIADH